MPDGVCAIVYSGCEPRLGVGSNRVQPIPSKYSSGHAWASLEPTDMVPSTCGVPGVKPTATRAGMPSVRAIAAIENEKWTQNPSLSWRNLAMALLPLPDRTSVLYRNPPVVENQSWSLTARAYAVVAPAVTFLAWSRTTDGNESGTFVYSSTSRFDGWGAVASWELVGCTSRLDTW